MCDGEWYLMFSNKIVFCLFLVIGYCLSAQSVENRFSWRVGAVWENWIGGIWASYIFYFWFIFPYYVVCFIPDWCIDLLHFVIHRSCEDIWRVLGQKGMGVGLYGRSISGIFCLLFWIKTWNRVWMWFWHFSLLWNLYWGYAHPEQKTTTDEYAYFCSGHFFIYDVVGFVEGVTASGLFSIFLGDYWCILACIFVQRFQYF